MGSSIKIRYCIALCDDVWHTATLQRIANSNRFTPDRYYDAAYVHKLYFQRTRKPIPITFDKRPVGQKVVMALTKGAA